MLTRTIVAPAALLMSLTGAAVAQGEVPRAAGDGANASSRAGDDGAREAGKSPGPVTAPTGDPSGVTGKSSAGTGPGPGSPTTSPAPSR